MLLHPGQFGAGPLQLAGDGVIVADSAKGAVAGFDQFGCVGKPSMAGLQVVDGVRLQSLGLEFLDLVAQPVLALGRVTGARELLALPFKR